VGKILIRHKPGGEKKRLRRSWGSVRGNEAIEALLINRPRWGQGTAHSSRWKFGSSKGGAIELDISSKGAGKRENLGRSDALVKEDCG